MQLPREMMCNWIEYENSFLRPQVPRGERLVFTTHGHCDCDTVLGRRRCEDFRTRPGISQKDLKKLRKKGWSEAKIERWKQEVSHTIDRNKALRQEQFESRRPEAEVWLNFIRDAMAAANAPHLGIFLHFYNDGGMEDEKIRLSRSERLDLTDVSPDFLMDVEQDVLYLFSRTDH